MGIVVCNSCKSEMVGGYGVWKGLYRTNSYSTPSDLCLALVANDPCAEAVGKCHNKVIYPHHYVCTNCGEVKLILDKKQIDEYVDMIKSHEHFTEVCFQRNLVKAEKKANKAQMRADQRNKLREKIGNLFGKK